MMKKLSDCSSRGKLMLLTGLLIAAPLAVLPFYPEDTKYIPAFALPALLSFLIGAVVCLMGHSGPASGSGSLTVLFAWGWGIVMGALPFFLGGQLSALQAVFESVSGWTTTGLSVMDVSKTPNIYLFHRSFMQFCGGLGFVMMMLLIAPDKRSMGLFQAEGHPDKLAPSLRRTARTVFSMYCGFLAFGTAAYRVVGMDLFDGLCHAMCALSTGGFSTRLNSIGEYQSLPIELVTILLMLVGTTNFAVLLLMVRRKWRQALRVSELRFMALLLAVFVPVTAFSLSSGLGMGLEEGFRRAAFDVASALSTTGYSTMSYDAWPPLAIGVLIVLMLIGGGIGSTAGGMKLSRVYLMLRLAGLNLRRQLSPNRRVEAPSYNKAQGKASIDSGVMVETVGFLVCYLSIFIVGSLLLTLTANCGLTEGMFEFASSLGTVGLSIGLTGPATGAGTLMVEICGMILGRLEIFIIFTGVRDILVNVRARLSCR